MPIYREKTSLTPPYIMPAVHAQQCRRRGLWEFFHWFHGKVRTNDVTVNNSDHVRPSSSTVLGQNRTPWLVNQLNCFQSCLDLSTGILFAITSFTNYHGMCEMPLMQWSTGPALIYSLVKRSGRATKLLDAKFQKFRKVFCAIKGYLLSIKFLVTTWSMSDKTCSQ